MTVNESTAKEEGLSGFAIELRNRSSGESVRMSGDSEMQEDEMNRIAQKLNAFIHVRPFN